MSWDGWRFRAGGTSNAANVPLYGLPIVGAEVYVVEGEKTADAARSVFDASAVCPLGGSSPAAGTDWSPLDGKHVYVLGDHDDAGRSFAKRVALAVGDAAAELRVLDPLEVYASLGGDGEPPAGWDVADPVELTRTVPND